MKKYILSLNLTKEATASSKAKLDIEAFLQQHGYELLSNKKQDKMQRLVRLISFSLNTFIFGSVLVLQHPFINLKKIKLLKSIFGSRLNTVSVIHDLNFLRKSNENSDEDKIEIEKLNICNYAIVHNRKMGQLLSDYKMKPKLIDLEVFDYEYFGKDKVSNVAYKTICFAGNLDRNKSGFVYKINELNLNNFSFHLYGPNYLEQENNEMIEYKGVFPADDLPGILNSQYGLIWDGDNLDCCSGATGEYLRYINPHKVSLYITAEVPIICWNEAAIAEFIRENNLGICIENLCEIESILNNITEKEYLNMKENIRNMKMKVNNGYYIKNALDRVEKLIIN